MCECECVSVSVSVCVCVQVILYNKLCDVNIRESINSIVCGYLADERVVYMHLLRSLLDDTEVVLGIESTNAISCKAVGQPWYTSKVLFSKLVLLYNKVITKRT